MPNLVEFARKDGFPNRIYRAYLHTKLFILGWLGFKTATWFSKDKNILSCDIVSRETFDFFSAPNIASTPTGGSAPVSGQLSTPEDIPSNQPVSVPPTSG